MSTDHQNRQRPFRLGVWFYYGQTLPPHEGIGVFVHNLTQGLLELDEPLELTLLIRPGDEAIVESLRNGAPERVRILPDQPLSVGLLNPRTYTTRWIALADRLGAWRDRFATRWESRRRAGWEWIQQGILTLLRRASYGNWLGILGILILAPVGLLASWLVFIVHCVVGAASRIVSAPFQYVDGLVRRCDVNPRFIAKPLFDVAREAGCDVWLFPHIDVRRPIDFPAVVFIHDLIPYRFPDTLPPPLLALFKATVPARSAEATLLACMSEVIKRDDLMGILGLPEPKIRVRPAIPPADMPVIPRDLARRWLPRQLKRPFLLYPAAFRSYKNHAALIEALAMLDHHEMELVFTGPKADVLPPDLERLARRAGVRDRIHVLGRVEREVLAALYQFATATLMPSRYEECAFPVYEAIQAGCPVACSDLPAMREQFAAMGDTMYYFDPDRPESIVSVIREFVIHGADIGRRQSQAGRVCWNRTWKDVAASWMEVFREAARMAEGKQRLAA